MNRTLNLKPNQWVPCGTLHSLGLQTYEITPCGALGGSETYEITPFGAHWGSKPYENAACGALGAVLGIANPMRIQHAAPLGLTMELSLGLQTLCEYSMRRPWGLPFLDTIVFS